MMRIQYIYSLNYNLINKQVLYIKINLYNFKLIAICILMDKIKLEKRLTKIFHVLSIQEIAIELESINQIVEMNFQNKLLKRDQDLDKISYIISECNLIKTLRLKIDGSFSNESLSNLLKKVALCEHIETLDLYFKNIKQDQYKLIQDMCSSLPETCKILIITVVEKQNNDNLLTSILSSLSKNNIIEYLDLSSNIFYTDSPIKALDALLHSSENLKTFKAQGLRFESFSINQINIIINNHFMLKDLDLSQCNINYTFFETFSQQLTINEVSTLKSLNFNMNNIDKRCLTMFLAYLTSSYCNLEKLLLKGNYIGDEGCQLLSDYMAVSKKIKVLNLSTNYIYDKGMNHLGNGIEFNSSLEKIILRDNYITDLGMMQFCEKVKKNNNSLKLRKIDITWNKIKAGGILSLKELYELFPIDTILISDNKINDDIASEFLERVAHNSIKPIRNIDIGFNEISNSSMIHLSEIIKKNENIEKLNLQNNRISNIGIQNISIYLEINNSITYLNVSKNLLNNEGCITLANCLKKNFVLTHLLIGENKVSDEGISKIAEIILIKRSFHVLECSHNLIGCEGAKSIGKNLEIAMSIKKIHINSNKIGDDGLKFLSNGIEINNSLEELNLENNNITDSGIEYLANALEDKKNFTSLNIACNKFYLTGSKHLAKIIKYVESINFSSSPICNRSLKILIEAYQSNANLKKLKMTNSEIGNKDNCIHLKEALIYNKTIKKFDFGYAKFDEISCQLIFPSLKGNRIITYLDLKSNNIGDSGMQGFAKYLSDCSLKFLFLQTNKIGQQGAFFLAEALKSNKSLLVLNLSDNNFGNQGMNYLCDALIENKTLKTLYVGYTGISYYSVYKIDTFLKKNSTLESFFIYGNNIGDKGINVILKSLMYNKTLLYLSVGGNSLTDKGLKDIHKYLAMNSKLILLEINTNKLTNISANLLSKSISLNNQITEINLINNTIDFEGVSKIMHSMKKNYSINQIKLLLNTISNDEKKIIVSHCEHLIFN